LKENILKNNTFPGELKEYILSISLPKFTWVCEIAYSERELTQKRATGIILLDATEVDTMELKPIILSAFNNSLLFYNENIRNFTEIPITLHPYLMFNDNLEKF